jgi:putative ABC transport system ATP-binding protein
MQLLGELHQNGTTLCMVTHDAAHARAGTRTVTLFDGRIVDEQVRS